MLEFVDTPMYQVSKETQKMQSEVSKNRKKNPRKNLDQQRS